MDYVIIAMLAVTVILLIVGIVLICRRHRQDGEQNNSVFSEDQEEYITDQLMGVVSLIKDNAVINANNIQDNIARNISSSHTAQAEWQRVSQEGLQSSINSFNTAQANAFQSLEIKLNENISGIRKEVTDALTVQRTEIARDSREMRDLLDSKVQRMQSELRENLAEIRQDNEKRLNEIKKTVDEQLQDTLNTRINESFKLISDQLQAVNKGLGEMATLTSGVNTLNKVLGNVKTRGIWGEVSLDNLLSQMLSPEQYAAQYSVVSGREAVDFAIFLPGKNREDKVVLPIDVKFPMSDYERLVEASENCDRQAMTDARGNLIKRIKDEAKSIAAKYIVVPHTTNFAIMYLPVEGLFAEVVREVGLIEDLQNQYRIVVAGPTTLTALLNSLQIGFKTMQIQEKSADVWKALQSFGKDFGKFRDNLEAMKKQVGTVSKTIDDSIKRTELIGKRLDKVSKIDYADEVNLLGGVVSEENEE